MDVPQHEVDVSNSRIQKKDRQSSGRCLISCRHGRSNISFSLLSSSQDFILFVTDVLAVLAVLWIAQARRLLLLTAIVNMHGTNTISVNRSQEAAPPNIYRSLDLHTSMCTLQLTRYKPSSLEISPYLFLYVTCVQSYRRRRARRSKLLATIFHLLTWPHSSPDDNPFPTITSSVWSCTLDKRI
jgi:hypothetical protein